MDSPELNTGAFFFPDSPFQITVHDGEEDLEEQIDGVYQHRQEVQPRFAETLLRTSRMDRSATGEMRFFADQDAQRLGLRYLVGLWGRRVCADGLAGARDKIEQNADDSRSVGFSRSGGRS